MHHCLHLMRQQSCQRLSTLGSGGLLALRVGLLLMMLHLGPQTSSSALALSPQEIGQKPQALAPCRHLPNQLQHQVPLPLRPVPTLRLLMQLLNQGPWPITASLEPLGSCLVSCLDSLQEPNWVSLLVTQCALSRCPPTLLLHSTLQPRKQVPHQLLTSPSRAQ